MFPCLCWMLPVIRCAPPSGEEQNFTVSSTSRRLEPRCTGRKIYLVEEAELWHEVTWKPSALCFRAESRNECLLLWKEVSVFPAPVFWPLTPAPGCCTELPVGCSSACLLDSSRNGLSAYCYESPGADQGLQVSGELSAAQSLFTLLCPHHPAPPAPQGPSQSRTASQAAAPTLLRSPSAGLHSAYTRLTGPISKLHPAPRLQAAGGQPAAVCAARSSWDSGSFLWPVKRTLLLFNISLCFIGSSVWFISRTVNKTFFNSNVGIPFQ